MTGTAITLGSEGGRAFDAYLAKPVGGRGPCVLCLHDMFGLHDVIRGVADRFASLGHGALVPNLFWRSENPKALGYDQHELAWPRLNAIDFDVASKDMAMGADFLRGQPFCNGKVVAVGFCGGGRWAYLAAARSGVDAAASLYGFGISEHLGELPQVRCPVQLHYGMTDKHIPLAEVEAVEAGMRGKPKVEVFRYEGAGHSFANPIRPTYDPAAAKLAFERIDRMISAL